MFKWNWNWSSLTHFYRCCCWRNCYCCLCFINAINLNSTRLFIYINLSCHIFMSFICINVYMCIYIPIHTYISVHFSLIFIHTFYTFSALFIAPFLLLKLPYSSQRRGQFVPIFFCVWVVVFGVGLKNIWNIMFLLRVQNASCKQGISFAFLFKEMYLVIVHIHTYIQSYLQGGT